MDKDNNQQRWKNSYKIIFLFNAFLMLTFGSYASKIPIWKNIDKKGNEHLTNIPVAFNVKNRISENFGVLTYVSSTPVSASTNVARNTSITLTFNEAVSGATVNATNIKISGSQTGAVAASFNGGGTTQITIDPTTDFKAGELITVTLLPGLQSLSTNESLSNPYTIDFTVAQDANNYYEIVGTPVRTIIDSRNGSKSIYPIDLDGDGDLDIVVSSQGDDEVNWYENDGNQNFTSHLIDTPIDPHSIFSGDLDNDGDLDIVVSTVATGANPDLIWYLNDGNENFTATAYQSEVHAKFRNVHLKDLDNDGDVDIVYNLIANNAIIGVRLNDGIGGFANTIHTTTLAESWGLFVADVDGDGYSDVVAADTTGGKIAWYKNNGSGSFSSGEHIVSTIPNKPRSVFAIDIDDDGDMDLLSASLGDDTVSWYQNDGNQNFTKINIDTQADGAFEVTASDVDGDGDIDVLLASTHDDTVALYLNDGSQSFTKKIITDQADGSRFVKFADLDSDGDLDIIGTSEHDDLLVWYENKSTVALSPKAFLQGPYDTGSGLMKDDLRSADVIPITSPYSNSRTVNPSVFDTTGNDAIVDWVSVELRDKNDISTIVVTTSALLQRDGDIVNIDGVSPIEFAADPDDYYVAIAHRNHVTIARDAVVTLSVTTQTLDFTSDNNAIRGSSAAVRELITGVYGMPAGDADNNTNIQVSDYNLVGSNLGLTSVYSDYDTNLNGSVQVTDYNLVLTLLGVVIQF